ncbi:MAG: PKD domain-containing protein [Thermoplasmata archaeon]|nr:PKD domain-containing protein [Thermoplasmata archaeon]MCI4355740.1 PKD domain-containing protein [Thermoplasmata archaeon]
MRTAGSRRARATALRAAVWLSIVLTLGALGSPASSPTNSHPAGPGVAAGVVVANQPILTLVPSPESGNAPLSVNVTVAVSGGIAPYNLSLCFGTNDHTSPAPNCGVGASGWNGTTELVFSHDYTTPGNFSVTGVVTDSRGSGVGSTALIVVTDRSVLAATADERTSGGAAPLSVTFNESVAGGTPPITLQWTYGDGTSGSELPGVPVVHVYETPGSFEPLLAVTDGAGHRTTQVLPRITVSAPGHAGGEVGSGALPGWPAIVGAFAIAAFTAGAVAVVVQHRRWRREGNELVAQLGSRRAPPATTRAKP